jgi:hypothetical protein
MSVESMIAVASVVCSVEQQTSARDASGGYEVTWATLYTGVTVAFEQTGSRVAEEFGKKFFVDDYVGYTTQAGIGIGMRFNVGGVYRRVTGQTFRQSPSGAIGDWYELSCEQRSDMQG